MPEPRTAPEEFQGRTARAGFPSPSVRTACRTAAPACPGRCFAALRSSAPAGLCRRRPHRPRHHVSQSDETSEQAVAVDVVREHRHAARAEPERAPLFPIGARLSVELVGEIPPIGIDIRLVIGSAEKPVEHGPVRQMPRRCELEAVQRHMGGVEVDRRDRSGGGHEIGENVAAAGCNRDDVAVRRNRQRIHIDGGIFPDLRVHQVPERPGEQHLEHAVARKPAASTDSLAHPAPGRHCFQAQSQLPRIFAEPPADYRALHVGLMTRARLEHAFAWPFWTMPACAAADTRGAQRRRSVHAIAADRELRVSRGAVEREVAGDRLEVIKPGDGGHPRPRD